MQRIRHEPFRYMDKGGGWRAPDLFARSVCVAAHEERDKGRMTQSAFCINKRVSSDVWLSSLLIAHAAGRTRNRTLLRAACAMALDNAEHGRLFTTDAYVMFPHSVERVLDPDDVVYEGRQITSFQQAAALVIWAAVDGLASGPTPFDPYVACSTQPPLDALFVDALIEDVGHAALCTLWDDMGVRSTRGTRYVRDRLKDACARAVGLFIAQPSFAPSSSSSSSSSSGSAVSKEARGALAIWVAMAANAAADALLWSEATGARLFLQHLWQPIRASDLFRCTDNVWHAPSTSASPAPHHKAPDGEALATERLLEGMHCMHQRLSPAARSALHIDPPGPLVRPTLDA